MAFLDRKRIPAPRLQCLPRYSCVFPIKNEGHCRATTDLFLQNRQSDILKPAKDSGVDDVFSREKNRNHHHESTCGFKKRGDRSEARRCQENHLPTWDASSSSQYLVEPLPLHQDPHRCGSELRRDWPKLGVGK